MLSVRVVFIVLLFVVISASPVEAGRVRVYGCEADDMRALISGNIESSWRSNDREIGLWRFSHFTSVTCNSSACILDTELSSSSPFEEEKIDVPSLRSSVLPPSPNAAVTRFDLVGEEAAEMRESLGPGSFDSDDGSKVLVWMDYGRISDMIKVRARAEIKCHIWENRCSIYDLILVYIGYNDDLSCGDLAAGMSPF